MAKAKYGNVITEMSGSINDNTYQRGRFGAIVRKKPHAINRKTASQVIVRNFFSTLSKGWALLTQAQRNSWLQATLNFQKIDSLAQTITLTGHQLYIAINRNLQSIGSALITVAPGKINVAGNTTNSVTAVSGTGVMTLTYTPALPATSSMLVFATAALSAGKNSISQNYKQIAVLATADVSPYLLAAEYEAVYGAGWKTAGAKLFFLYKVIDELTGQESATSYSQTIVA